MQLSCLLKPSLVQMNFIQKMKTSLNILRVLRLVILIYYQKTQMMIGVQSVLKKVRTVHGWIVVKPLWIMFQKMNKMRILIFYTTLVGKRVVIMNLQLHSALLYGCCRLLLPTDSTKDITIKKLTAEVNFFALTPNS